MKPKSSLLIASILATSAMMESDPYFGMYPLKSDHVRDTNKYKLTPEQIETMKDMSPKEKKKYLREILK